MNSLSKLKAKYIKSLQLKKNRIQEGLFIVEGEKSVFEFLDSDFVVREVVCTAEFLDNFNVNHHKSEFYTCSEAVLSSLGSFKNNNTTLAVVEMRKRSDYNINENSVILALDQINDPGNLGTIIRIADWFGIELILLRSNSVDVYNPKVVSATKGSLTRVNVIETNLEEDLASFSNNIYAADLSGVPIGTVDKIKSGIILMGSESHGISQDLIPYVTKKITIPKLGGAESLNVAVATGIICNQLLV